MAILFVSLIPQFITAGSSFALDSVELALIFDVTGLCWLMFLSMIIGTGRDYLKLPKVRRILDALTGSVLVALGIVVATGSS